jgi:diketogulonate reductase-like aldo/keto reductase
MTAIADETIISIAGKYNTTSHAIILSWVLHTAALTVKSMHHQEENLTSMHIMTEDDFDAIEEKNIRTIQKR